MVRKSVVSVATRKKKRVTLLKGVARVGIPESGVPWNGVARDGSAPIMRDIGQPGTLLARTAVRELLLLTGRLHVGLKASLLAQRRVPDCSPRR